MNFKKVCEILKVRVNFKIFHKFTKILMNLKNKKAKWKEKRRKHPPCPVCCCFLLPWLPSLLFFFACSLSVSFVSCIFLMFVYWLDQSRFIGIFSPFCFVFFTIFFFLSNFIFLCFLIGFLRFFLGFHCLYFLQQVFFVFLPVFVGFFVFLSFSAGFHSSALLFFGFIYFFGSPCFFLGFLSFFYFVYL